MNIKEKHNCPKYKQRPSKNESGKMAEIEDYYLDESEARTEFAEAESGIVLIVIEEHPAEMTCVVTINDHKDKTSYDLNCTISCESIEIMNRCRKQMVNTFASFLISPRGLIGEDQFDFYSIMDVGTGVYSNCSIDTIEGDKSLTISLYGGTVSIISNTTLEGYGQ